MTAALDLRGVTKQFGDHHVLRGLDLTVEPGQIFGFIGENGAGKTTTMRLILGLERPDAGTLQVFGQPVTFGRTPTNKLIGYLPDVPAFYGDLSAREYLRLCAAITSGDPADIAPLLHEVGLADDRRHIAGFSRGMKQRLGIAQALLGKPQLLICDEPTSALDPAGRNDFLALLSGLRGSLTIVLSTHILTDVERICDHVGILHDGVLQEQGPLADLKNKYAQAAIALTFATEAETATAAKILNVPATNTTTLTLPYTGEYAPAATQVMAALAQSGVAPLTFARVDPTLDQVFMEVIR
ncbi:ABC transporter ATP-binding protein [Lacticaseibacillus mingshuiensis]|uniref:ATP-binding cassette domain-containing protein n=1 Tax=Lacticaseibacillus mingshuiensis TaxID=2799574 RepID=A0ABW4CK08_9LACO|nr:ABC transporter ATP-binding protein [Lacticaseibacillus mingshuiensis]